MRLLSLEKSGGIICNDEKNVHEFQGIAIKNFLYTSSEQILASAV